MRNKKSSLLKKYQKGTQNPNLVTWDWSGSQSSIPGNQNFSTPSDAPQKGGSFNSQSALSGQNIAGYATAAINLGAGIANAVAANKSAKAQLSAGKRNKALFDIESAKNRSAMVQKKYAGANLYGNYPTMQYGGMYGSETYRNPYANTFTADQLNTEEYMVDQQTGEDIAESVSDTVLYNMPGFGQIMQVADQASGMIRNIHGERKAVVEDGSYRDVYGLEGDTPGEAQARGVISSMVKPAHEHGMESFARAAEADSSMDKFKYSMEGIGDMLGFTTIPKMIKSGMDSKANQEKMLREQRQNALKTNVGGTSGLSGQTIQRGNYVDSPYAMEMGGYLDKYQNGTAKSEYTLPTPKSSRVDQNINSRIEPNGYKGRTNTLEKTRIINEYDSLPNDTSYIVQSPGFSYFYNTGQNTQDGKPISNLTMPSSLKNTRPFAYGGSMNKYRGGGLYANIHAKQARIKAGSGEKMRSPGDKGAPSAQDFKDAAKTAKKQMGGSVPVYGASGMVEYGYGGMKKYMGGGMAVSNGVPRKYANAELEGGEVIEKQTGPDIYVKGPSHENGGVPMRLQEGGPARGGDYVWSDHLTYKGKTMAELYAMAVENGASEEEIDQLRMLQEQLAGRAGEPQDAKELQEMPAAKTGGMLKKYQKGSGALGEKSFGEKLANYTPEIASGIGALAQVIGIATAKNPYKGMKAPKPNLIATPEKQFFERTDSRAQEAANQRGASLTKQLLQQAGFGPSETAAIQKAELDRAAADAQATQQAREFNIQQDRAEKQLNTEMKLRADIANQEVLNKAAEAQYALELEKRMFETERTQAGVGAVAGMARDIAATSGDYREALAIQGKQLSRRARTYDQEKAEASIRAKYPYDKNKETMAEYEARIQRLVNEDAKKHQDYLNSKR